MLFSDGDSSCGVFVPLQFNGVKDSSVPIFCKARVADTLTYGYLEMLGVLSKQKEGIE